MKYNPYPPMKLEQRTWPDAGITGVPRWCSVDLRDGNQALAQPMSLSKRLKLYDLIVRLGFKEIEVAFPSASREDFEFTRHLIDQGLVPDDVAIQVIMPGRREHIDRTFEAVRGAKNAIVHLYYPTSRLHREIVFKKTKKELKESILSAVDYITQKAVSFDTDANISFEFSPESLTGTETDFALEICQECVDLWRPTTNRELILNLPATVELSMPNIFADQVEWFCAHLRSDEHCTVSIHPHNDRGTAVAATELALLAGAQRVEGTLFGAGERSGNVDLITLALNCFTQGFDPRLDLSNIDAVAAVFEECIGMQVPPRHPYAGKLIYTAYSGSHQDAIRKGLKKFNQSVEQDAPWEIPYVPMDPKDIGRDVSDLIGVSSQSGKGGYGFLVETRLGVDVPDWLARSFSQTMQGVIERTGRSPNADEIFRLFERSYVQQTSKDSEPLSQGEIAPISNTEAALDFLRERVALNHPMTRVVEASFGHSSTAGMIGKVVGFFRFDRGDGSPIDIVSVGRSLAECVVGGVDPLFVRCASNQQLHCTAASSLGELR